MRRNLLALAPAALLAASGARAEIPAALVNELKPVIVNIEVAVQHGINSEGTGLVKGSGFILDAKRGIIATNRHVVGTSPGRIKVVFEDGQTAQARHWYYDVWHDFAFIRIESPVPPGLKAARLGDSRQLEEQQDVLLIGNNDAQEYSVKYGKTANLHLCKGIRHSAAIQTTFDRTGGSSGSPVFNRKGELVAIHFAGTDSTSFEMRVEYLKDALEALLAGRTPRRGDIGVQLDLMLISDAQKHFHLPDSLAAEVLALRKDIKRVAVIEHVVPRSEAARLLQPGDVVLTVDGAKIGDDVYHFDKLVDARVGRALRVAVVRNGKTLEFDIPVRDAEADKIGSFALFAGGVVQEVTPEQRLRFNIEGEGVFLSQGEKGSSLSGLGREGAHTKYLVLIEGVNGVKTPNLAGFLEAVRPLKDGDQIYVLIQDRWVTQSISSARPVRLDLKFFPLRVFDWSPAALDWIPRDG